MADAPAGGPEAQFRAYLARGQFMIQRSRSSGRHVFYPRVAEPGTGATDLDWVAARGTGTVYATTVNRRRPEDGGSYNVAIIELDEGVRLMSRVDNIAPEKVAIGMKVKARIAEIDGAPQIVFDPA